MLICLSVNVNKVWEYSMYNLNNTNIYKAFGNNNDNILIGLTISISPIKSQV